MVAHLKGGGIPLDWRHRFVEIPLTVEYQVWLFCLLKYDSKLFYAKF